MLAATVPGTQPLEHGRTARQRMHLGPTGRAHAAGDESGQLIHDTPIHRRAEVASAPMYKPLIWIGWVKPDRRAQVSIAGGRAEHDHSTDERLGYRETDFGESAHVSTG